MSIFTKKQVEDEFKRYSERVEKDDVSDVLDKEGAIINKVTGPLKDLSQDIKLFFSLIKDYKNGIYKEVPWTTVAAVVGSLLYIFSPIDLIPDFIPVAGLLDDVAVVGVCLKAISSDLNVYKQWKKVNNIDYKIIEEDNEK
jgi:uncharacterized membrane protein YkvA (DUF1232 family)